VGKRQAINNERREGIYERESHISLDRHLSANDEYHNSPK